MSEDITKVLRKSKEPNKFRDYVSLKTKKESVTLSHEIFLTFLGNSF